MILTVSGLGTSKDEFKHQISDLFPKSEVNTIQWQIDRGPQVLMDLLDSRDGKKVIIKVAEQFVQYLEVAVEEGKHVVIISQAEGSRIAEEGLSMVSGFDKLEIDIKHIMLGPEIDHSDWASIGKYATAAAVMGLAGLALAATRNKKGLATAVLGVLGGAMIANKESVTDHLDIRDEKSGEKPKFVKMDRYIFINPENEHFDGLREHIHSGTYYKGIYDMNDIASLESKFHDQEYRFEKWLRTQEKTKVEILRDLVKV